MQRYERTRVSFCFFLMLGFVFFIGAGIPDAAAQNDYNYQWSESARSLTVFQPGDAVRIQVHELEMKDYGVRNLNLSGDYPINPEGFIVMPLIGQVKVKGYTVYEVMEALKERFVQYLKKPYIYVRPLIRLTLQGAFNEPGAYHVDPSSSVWDVVELAGGPDKECDLSKMRVERGGKVVISNVLEAFEQGISLEEVGIESGDQIIAPVRGGIGLATLMTIFNLFASMVLVYLRLKQGTL